MDIAKSLMKCVARAFYDTKHILVLDALMVHHAVRDDELAKLLALQTKDLHKLCGKLTEDRLLAVYSRLEQREGQSRPVNRTWYFLDYRAAIDAIKWRMKRTVDEVEVKMNKDADAKDYVCPRCRRKLAVLDAIADIDEMGMFLCDRCHTQLVEDDDNTPDKATQERLSRFMQQTNMIVELLRKVDETVVPENDFDSAYSIAVPVPQDKTQLSKPFVPVDRPTKKGVTSSIPAALAVEITDSSEKSAIELAAEQARKQQQAEKNSLPVWHTQSTVDPGAVTSAGVKEAAERAARERDGTIAAKQEEAAGEEGDTVDSNEAGIFICYFFSIFLLM
ncbi:TFIIE alpha subunit-domain-containing protein [Geopyxis carbonaria]|nr:TFIIE alpha subunit-domain-containing protein [Geopyxis carbonaria]